MPNATANFKTYQVGGGALLDYMPRIVTSPLDQARAGRHPLSITASITYGTQTMADRYPPGAPSPSPNNAWRMASTNDGPEWPDGDRIELELWATVSGRHYVFVLPPFALMRSG